MKKSMKLIDENVICTESLQDYLQDNTEFLVVGIVGSQSVGKSTVLNMLVHNELSEDNQKTLFKFSKSSDENDCDIENIKHLADKVSNLDLTRENKNLTNLAVFKTENSDDAENGLHRTQGIDIFVANNRVSLFFHIDNYPTQYLNRRCLVSVDPARLPASNIYICA